MKMKDADYEKMIGQDIDAFLDDSEWDIESFDKMSQYSRGTNRSGANEMKLKKMEKVYLQRLESSNKKGSVAGAAETSGKKSSKPKKPPAFREFQDRF